MVAKKDEMVIAKELRERNPAELQSLLEQKREQLHKERFKHARGQLRETHVLLQLRRDVARIRTVLGQKTAQAAQTTAQG